MVQSVPGRIQSIVNIHNLSIEVHPVDKGIKAGALVILVPGGDTTPEFWRGGEPNVRELEPDCRMVEVR